MKNFLLFFFVVITVFSCKRGENDPFFSIYTRDNRITEKWQLKDYILTDLHQNGVSISFNNLACDMDDETSDTTTTTNIENEFDGTILDCAITSSVGSQGFTRSFEINFEYQLDIRRDGTYEVDGTYNYNDDVSGGDVNGTFTVDMNEWFWVDDDKDKSAIKLLDFPVIDAQNILDYGSPVKNVSEFVFEIKELRKDKMVWEIENSHLNTNNLTSDTFAFGDSLTNCIKTTQVFEKVEFFSTWNFEPAP